MLLNKIHRDGKADMDRILAVVSEIEKREVILREFEAERAALGERLAEISRQLTAIELELVAEAAAGAG